MEELKSSQKQQQPQKQLTEEQLKLVQDFENIKQQLYKEIEESPVKNYFYGSVYAAFIGDSMGSYLEFRDSVVPRMVYEALKMPGGGEFQVAPGQVTDDSELALSLTRGLIKADGSYDEELVAQQYSDWLNSPPFDIGNTIQNSLIPCYSFNEGLGPRIRQSSKNLNQFSQSNGAIMKITPLAVWGYQLPDETMTKIIEDEITLTHSNKIVVGSSIVYVLAIKHLVELGIKKNITYEDKVKETLDYSKKKIYELVDKDQQLKELIEWWADLEKAWEKKSEYAPIDPADKIGWVKIAWTFAFYYLGLTPTIPYRDVYKRSMFYGGDTDTNAAIAAGLVGAAKGLKELIETEPDWFQTLVQCDFKKGMYQEREQKWNPNQLLTLLPKLFECAQKANQKNQNYLSATEREKQEQEQQQQNQQN